MGKAPSRTQDQFIVRLPEGMRQVIRRHATDNGRSMNAEIVARILDSLDAEMGVAVVKVDTLAGPDELERAADRLDSFAAMLRERARKWRPGPAD